MKRASAAQWQAVCQYIRDTADTLTLRDWTIIVQDLTPDADDAAASIKSTYGRRRAQMRLRRDWYNEMPEDIRHYVVHELLHLHHEGTDTVLHGLKPTLGTAIFEPVYEAYKWQMELATDAVAEAIAPLLPLPIIPDGPEDMDPEEPSDNSVPIEGTEPEPSTTR